MIDAAAALALIGYSHLLQPPLTLVLARALGLRAAFEALPALASGVARNMAFASVALPTSWGVWLALHAREAFMAGGIRQLAWLLASFWTWRLLRQLKLRAAWSPRAMSWWWVLTLIFLLQGPMTLLLLGLGTAD